MHVDHADTLADQVVHLTVTGLAAHESVSIGAKAVDHDGKQWHGEATFTADDHGTIDLDRAKPSAGSYQDVDGMGLFWSMNPPDGNPDGQWYVPPDENGRPVEHVDVFVTRKGKRVASTTVTRQWLSSGVTTRPVSLTKDKISGTYAAPRRDQVRHPAVLLFGGSEGGDGLASIADLLASHGYPALSVAYFHASGLPDELRDIPLEYFATAAQWLERQPEVDPAHVIVMSASRGTEAALLVSEHFPKLIHGAVLYAPSAVIHPSFPHFVGEPWTLHGRELPEELIPVGHIDGPVLAVAGSDDRLWGSMSAAPLIVQELNQAHHRFAHRALVVPNAGHGVGGAPYLPRGTSMVNPVTGVTLALGGTRAANESALRQGWTQVLAVLASLQH
ncbi:MAG TPA: acyl-CoA thioesterase/bile acid-CoA:amino acid N-acyltransferase family protein [Kribbella sp.]|nr:acyl-CoA thioesterase/bile acid-CoA:amino acid N-acyltransferase family protein [Kribbella sp.]